MSADRHNEFVRRHVQIVGRDLLVQGTFEQQLVALESLIAGLFAAIIEVDPKPRNADAYLSALTHGIRRRVRQLQEGKRDG
jgi:hypothetical protein